MENEINDYGKLRNELETLLAFFCRKLTSYALLEDISELQGIGFSAKELQLSSNEDIVNIAEHILNRTSDYLMDLEDYDITSDKLLQLRELVDLLKKYVHNCELLVIH